MNKDGPASLSISISGVDGSGKTTVISELVRLLTARGVLVHTEWLRFSHSLSLPVLAAARVLGVTERIQLADGRRISVHRFSKAPRLGRLYAKTTMLEMRWAVSRAVRRAARRRAILICDRFVQDTVVDLSLSLGQPGLSNSGLGGSILSLQPQGHVAFVILAPPAVLVQRRPENAADPAFPSRVAAYKHLATTGKMRPLDGEENPSKIVEQIIQEVSKSVPL